MNDIAPFTVSQGHLVEDIHADMNIGVAIEVYGRGNIIRNNQVVKTRGSYFYPGPYGISAYGPGARVLNNDVIETKEQGGGTATGIALDSAPGSVVENNRIGNSSLGPGTSFGIYIGGSTDVLVSNNRVTTMNCGVFYSTVGSGSNGKYRDNLTSGVATPYTGGTDALGNN